MEVPPLETPTPRTSAGGPLRRLYQWVLSWADTPYGTPALAIVSFCESSFFPVPPDPLLIALAIGRPERAVRLALLCTLASVLGGLLGYAIGYWLMETVGEGIVAFFSLEDSFAAVSEKLVEFGFFAIVLAALTPLPYKVFTIAAGAVGISIPVFIVASIIGRGVRFLGEGILIRIYGESIRKFIDRWFGIITWAALILGILGIAATQWLTGSP
ncbi:MAG TPA: DedA family protein [Planctomycetes bacterium]|nr:DedA family protein [Planctomycetota bacterium]